MVSIFIELINFTLNIFRKYKDKKMRLNKTVKALAIALPMFALAACNSSSDVDEQSQVDSNETSQSAATSQTGPASAR